MKTLVNVLGRIKNFWLRCNIQYFLVGIVIGTFINIIFTIGADNPRSWKNLLVTYIVSIIITLCITNISLFTTRIIKKKFSTPAINMLIYYFVVGIGVIIGSELSYLFIMIIYNIPFSEINQTESLKLNLALGFIAGTIIYVYQLQDDNYKLKISEKEVQLLKLNELKTQADLKTLQARINPHFLYNALNSITSLIHEEPDKAEEMTIKLSQLFRYSINTQEANWATVKEEMEIVTTYFDIERVRFGNRIKFIAKIDDKIKDEKIPRFLLQPLVENALKHGLKDKIEEGELTLSIKAKNGHLDINVFDNGDPFPEELMAGYGLQSTIDKLNLLYNTDWKMNYINVPLKRINIEIPKKHFE